MARLDVGAVSSSLVVRRQMEDQMGDGPIQQKPSQASSEEAPRSIGSQEVIFCWMVCSLIHGYFHVA